KGYRSYAQYGVGAYSKPVMMLHSLAAYLGDSTFHAFLHEYYRASLLRQPRPADVLAAAGKASGRDLSAWFRPWLRDTGIALDHRTGRPPLRLKPLVDFTSSEAMTFLYGPMLWHGRAEGARLGVWTAGRYLPSSDFPDGVLFAGGCVTVGMRRGDLSLGGWAGRRVGAGGAG